MFLWNNRYLTQAMFERSMGSLKENAIHCEYLTQFYLDVDDRKELIKCKQLMKTKHSKTLKEVWQFSVVFFVVLWNLEHPVC